MCTHVIKWLPKPIDDVRQPDDVRLKSQMHGINDYAIFKAGMVAILLTEKVVSIRLGS